MTKRRRKSKKWISWLIFLVLLVAAGAICFFVWDGYFREKPKDKPETSQQKSVDDNKTTPAEEKKEEKKEEPTEEPKEEEKKVPQYDGGDPNKGNEITGVITYAGVNNGTLMIRVNIDQLLSGGKCNLGLRRDGGNLYGAEASVVGSASTSSCDGFNVPVAGLGSGKTQIVIYINSGDKSGEIHGEVDL